jgi:PIN domain nuclease of toxin-antitoxin system
MTPSPRQPGTRSVAVPRGAWRAADHARFAGPALIDTHIWLWYLDGVASEIAPDALALLRRAVVGPGLYVSDMSVWEIGTKSAKGKLALAPSTSAWIDRAAEQPGFRFAPLDRAALLASTQLPGTIHGDPVDRILIATASGAGIPLVTVDRAIIEYAQATKAVSICDARP